MSIGYCAAKTEWQFCISIKSSYKNSKVLWMNVSAMFIWDCAAETGWQLCISNNSFCKTNKTPYDQ